MQTPYGQALHPTSFRPPFDEVIRELLDKAHLLYDSLRGHMRPPWKDRCLQVSIVDNRDFNAYTSKNTDSDRIYIFRGSIEGLYGTFLGLLSTPIFMPAMGNALMETMPPELGTGGFPPINLVRGVAQLDDATALIPNDQDRIVIADMLVELALEFLLYHEIGHILGGHLEIPSRGEDTLAIAEAADTPDALGGSVSRAIKECDADAFTCHITSFVHTAETVASSYRNVVEVHGLGSQDFALITYLSFVGVLFRKLYPHVPVRISAYESSYPHPAVRACVVALATLSRQTASGKVPHESLRKVMEDSIGNLEEVWARLCLPGQNPEVGADWAQSIVTASMTLAGAYSRKKTILDQYARLPRKWDNLRWPEGHGHL
jgi:hypothetical protein